MTRRVSSTHTIRIAAPISQCHLFFTPAGEELWVEGWKPQYVLPRDGTTEAGMVFTTGAGDDLTIWTMIDFDTRAYYSRYARVTPASRTGFVEVRSFPVDAQTTDVTVSYTLTALSDLGESQLSGLEGDAFVAMIESWKAEIDAQLPRLLEAKIR